MQIRYVTKLLLTLVGGLAVVFASLTANAQSMEGIDSKHIFPDASFVMAVQLNLLEEQLGIEQAEQLQEIHDWLEQLLLLDTSKCTQASIQLRSSRTGLNESLGFTFQAQEDIDADQIEGLAERYSLDESTYEGQTFYTTGREPAFLFSGASLMICEVQNAKWLIEQEASDKESEIVERISLSAAVGLHADLREESTRESLVEMITAYSIDEELVRKMMEQCDSFSGQIRFDEDRQFQLTFQLKEDTDVQAFQELNKQFLAQAIDWSNKMPGIFGSMDPSPAFKEEFSTLFGVFSEVIENAEVTVDGNEVIVEAGHENAAQIVNSLVTAMKAIVDMFGAP